MKKKILAMLLAMAVAFSVPMSASAAWRKDSAGHWQWWRNGSKQTGWQDVYWSGYDSKGVFYWHSGWYYFDTSGNMVTGWKFLSNKWYYLNSDGKMQTGWKFLDGNWYYFDKSGAMHTGWLKEPLLGFDKDDDCEWYYLFSDGKMAKGWQTIGGNRYYLHSDGKMAKEVFIDGYWFDSSGKAVERKQENDDDIKKYTSIDDLIDKWNKEYRKVSTPFGDVKLTFEYSENQYGNTAYDYRIYTGWSGFSPYDIKYSNKYTDSQKSEMKEILKTIQEEVAMDVFKYLPGKKVKGGYHTGFYEYPTLQVGYTAIRFLSWENYTELSYTDPAYSLDKVYQNAKVDRLHWIKYVDDYDFH